MQNDVHKTRTPNQPAVDAHQPEAAIESEGYLSGYIDNTETVSYISEQVSVERILAAANEIERMLNVQNYRNGLLYKHCDDFKKFCRMLSQEKEKSSTS